MKFKTAKELGLSEEHYCALVKTMDALDKNLIRHITSTELEGFPGAYFRERKPGRFNMSHWQTDYKGCGTVCCIGGTAEMLAGLPTCSLSEVSSEIPGLMELFYPSIDEEDWDKIKPRLAARAIRNYLTYGEPRWTEVMEPPLSKG